MVYETHPFVPIFDYEMKIAPASKIPGEKTCKYQPSVKLPEPFARNIFKKEDVTNLNKESNKHVLSIINKSNFGFFEPYEINKDTIKPTKLEIGVSNLTMTFIMPATFNEKRSE